MQIRISERLPRKATIEQIDAAGQEILQLGDEVDFFVYLTQDESWTGLFDRPIDDVPERMIPKPTRLAQVDPYVINRCNRVGRISAKYPHGVSVSYDRVRSKGLTFFTYKDIYLRECIGAPCIRR